VGAAQYLERVGQLLAGLDVRGRALGAAPSSPRPITFAEANDFQRALLQSSDDYILVFEHPPTYTARYSNTVRTFPCAPESLKAW